MCRGLGEAVGAADFTKGDRSQLGHWDTWRILFWRRRRKTTRKRSPKPMTKIPHRSCPSELCLVWPCPAPSQDIKVGWRERKAGRWGGPVRPAHVLRSPDHLQPCGSTCRIARVGFTRTSRGSAFRGHDLRNGGDGNCDAFRPHPGQRLRTPPSNPGQAKFSFIFLPHFLSFACRYSRGDARDRMRVQGQGSRHWPPLCPSLFGDK